MYIPRLTLMNTICMQAHKCENKENCRHSALHDYDDYGGCYTKCNRHDGCCIRPDNEKELEQYMSEHFEAFL